MGGVETGVESDEFTQVLIRFMDARVAGRRAEGFLCCEARSYALIYGSEELGHPDLYVVESREDDSRSQVTFRISYEGRYRSEPEDIIVRRVGSVLKIAEIHFLGD